MAQSENAFKQFVSYNRGYNSEENFNLGMFYTDSPIEPGKLRVLFNYDVAVDGFSLKPRLGLRTSKVTLPTDDYDNFASGSYLKSKLSSVVECPQGDTPYKYVTMFDTETNLFLIGTTDGTVSTDIISGIETERMSQSFPGVSIKCNSFAAAKMHDLAIAPGTLSYEQVGTLAWNNSYFFFGQDASDHWDLYNIKFNETTKIFEANKVVPTALTAKESVPNKFNMLLDDPYAFTNAYAAGTILLQGVLPYDGANLIVSPRINKKYTYKLSYTVPQNNKYQIKWEWKDFAGTEWTTINTEVITFSASTPAAVTCDFASPIKNSLLRITATGYTGVDLNTYPDQVMAINISCDSETQVASANANLKKYNLYEAKGMCYWQNRLVLWGFEDPIIFVSEANLPEWFPYPNNIDLFEEPIVHCEPYLDRLLVFTTKKLYQLSMLSDGSGWSKTCIQDHLYLTDFDTNFIQTIKGMMFFKSGNSFYMVVPSATYSTGLTVAPIAKPIQWFLDTFNTSVKKLLNDIYNYSGTLELVHCFDYINFNDVVVNYVFKTTHNCYINFCFVYDTTARTWRIHTFESQTIYSMFRPDATKDGTLVTLTPISQRFTTSPTTTIVVDSVMVQYFDKEDTVIGDYYIPMGFGYLPALLNTTDESSNIQVMFDATHVFPNYQYIDTGYRTQGTPNNKKRHREFQLRFNNKSSEPLKFGTSFYIDGEDRKNMFKYDIVEELSSDGYNNISVVPSIQYDTCVAGTTILGETDSDINAWELGLSAFPEAPLYKVRVAVSGKGYANRLKLLSINEKDYELLGICWVYKLKNLR